MAKKHQLIEKVISMGIVERETAEKMTIKMLKEVIKSDKLTVDKPLELDVDKVSKDELVEQAVETGALSEDNAERMTKTMIVDVLDDIEVVDEKHELLLDDIQDQVIEPVEHKVLRKQKTFKVKQLKEGKPFIRVTARLMRHLKEQTFHKQVDDLKIVHEEHGDFFIREVDRVKPFLLTFDDEGKPVIKEI